MKCFDDNFKDNGSTEKQNVASPRNRKPQIMFGLDDPVGVMLSYDRDPSKAKEHWKRTDAKTANGIRH